MNKIIRQTPSRINAAEYAMKNAENQGIILEEQNESMYNSSNGNSVSGSDDSDSDEESRNSHQLYINLKKTVSNPISLQSKLIQGDDNSIKAILSKITKKDSNLFSTKDCKLEVPKRESEAHSAWFNSSNNIMSDMNINKCVNSPETENHSVNKSKKRIDQFKTDLNVLKNADQSEKSRVVMSRLKMMI